ncbi:MAG: glycosyltransferase family 2 protein [Veillonellales bacterium]
MQKVVGLLFSKDRAMQLDAALSSLALHCLDMESIDLKVIWTCSGLSNEQQYQELANNYPSVTFIRQSNFPEQVLANIAGYEYVLFLVDDNIFVRNFSIHTVIENLSNNQDVLGFSLRLGTNTIFCYPLNREQQLPVFTVIVPEFLKFDWTAAQYDFGYPLEVSSSVYRVKDIAAILQHNPFFNPNTLEIALDTNKASFDSQKKFLLCSKHSYTFCNPVNKVQTIINNRSGEAYSYSPNKLSEMFTQGYRINVEAYRDFIPNGCHQEVELKFKKAAGSSQSHYLPPKVSVIMPVYNAQDYLREAIDSILSQTFIDFEFIIIDDGSTDNSLPIIKSYADPRIRLIRNETNLKLITSLNKGMNLAHGKYIARMDADDISLPDRLAKQVDFMDQHPDIAVCGTWVELFGKPCEQTSWHFTDNPAIAKCILLFGCCLAHPSAMIRRTVLESGFCYSYSYPHAEDYGLWVQIARNHNIASIPQVLFKYRLSDSQKSAKEAQQVLDGTAKIQLEQLNRLGIEPTQQECLLHLTIGQCQFPPDISFAHGAFTWLSKLKTANSQLNYYPEPTFTNVLRMYWTKVCQSLVNAL